MERRRFLKLGGAVGVASGLAGCSALLGDDEAEPTNPGPEQSGTPSVQAPGSNALFDTPTTLRGIEFDTVLDVVADLGMDPTGREPIDDALNEGYGDKTLLVFPPGTYLAADEHLYRSPTRQFGLLGLGESRRDVQFVFPPGNEGAPDPSDYRFLSFQKGRDVLVENLTFQMTDDDVTGVETVFTLDDGFWMVDVEFAGFMPREAVGPSNSVIAHITHPNGVGVIRRFVSTGGGVVEQYPSRGTPIGVFRGHRGELRIEDAHIEESGSHSIYASRTQGCVRVEGGLFRNNDNTNLRISGGGHPTKQSWIKNARVEIDVDKATRLPPGENYQGIRGIWVESGGTYSPGYSDLLIENVDAVVYSNGAASDLPLLLIDTTHGSVTVRDSQFRSFVEDVEPIDVRRPDTGVVRGATDVRIENTVIETSAQNVIDEGAAVSIVGRPNSRIVGSTIKLVDGWVDGIYVEDSDGFWASDTQITAVPPVSPPTADDIVSDAFGWNTGVIIRNSDGCHLRRLTIDVAGPATDFRNSQVRLEDVLL